VRTIKPWMRQLLNNGGPFVGELRPSSRVTVEPAFWLTQSSGPVGTADPSKLPIRWWQRQDNSQIEMEIPNISMVTITEDMTQSAATVEIDIFNTSIPTNGTAQAMRHTLGNPGWFSWNYGSTQEAQARWNQLPNAWANVLRENALIRVYQGYGGAGLTIPEAVANGNLLLKGVFLLDSPAIESNGITKLNGRNMAKLLIDQVLCPPLVPPARYPMNYSPPTTGTTVFKAVPGYGTGSWAQQRGVFDTTSGGGAGGALAMDNNAQTAWVGEVHNTTAGVTWIQVDSGELVSGVYINPWMGNYTCFVSVMVNGAWIGSGNIDGIPFVTQFGVGFETAAWHKLPNTVLASKIRISFTNLYHFNGGFYGGIRELLIGSTGTVPDTPLALNGAPTDKIILDLDMTASGGGYRLFGSDGGVFDYGDAKFLGSEAGAALNKGLIGGAGTISNDGYWLAAADGGVFTKGDAAFYQSLGDTHINEPIVAFRKTSTDHGYWMLGADGGVFSFGDAAFYGSGAPLTGAENYVDFAPTPTGNGYWLLGEDGGVFAFGGAGFHGAGPTGHLFVGIESTIDGGGYWIVADDGAVFSFGSAQYYGGANVYTGTTTPVVLAAPISGIKRTLSGAGYWLVGQDGGVFTYGDAGFLGSLPGDFTGSYSLPGDYNDYAEVIIDLALWAGFWLYPPDGIMPAGQAPQVYGNIEFTGGAYNSVSPLAADYFDEKTVIDVMETIAGTIGYHIRVDDQGGLIFQEPNFWASGNFLEDGTPTSELPVLDERVNISDYIMTQTDQELKSPIVVATQDPYLVGGPAAGTFTTTFIPPYTPLLKGITKSAGFWVPTAVTQLDQEFLAELLGIRIWLQSRTATTTAWADPSICIDDQVQIYERNASETSTHYVTAITTTHDTQTGKYEMQLTTYWLGDQQTWALNNNTDSFFGAGAAVPTTVSVPAVQISVQGASIGQSLPQSTINVSDTTGVVTAGTANITTDAGVQTVLYTGITEDQLLGCTGGTGVMAAGATVAVSGASITVVAPGTPLALSVDPSQVGLTLPLEQIIVIDTHALGTSGSGLVHTDAGSQAISWAGKTATTLVGVSGGIGTLTPTSALQAFAAGTAAIAYDQAVLSNPPSLPVSAATQARLAALESAAVGLFAQVAQG
jgi:hypothetical protein